MSSDLLLVLGLLAVVVTLFIVNRPRMDVVALLVILFLPLSGILTVEQALAGFSDPNVVLIAALFVIGEGLVRTGIAYRIGEWMSERAGRSEARLLVLLMVAVAGLGAVMSSTGVVAIFIPVVLSIAARLKLSPSRLMMPLSFAGLISGMLSLVATPPNVVVHSELVRHGLAGFSFFSFTPFGLVVLVLGIGYMLLTRHWLNGEVRKDGRSETRRTLLDLVLDYKLSGRERRLRIRPHSPLIGHTLGELELRTRHGANVVGIERQHKFTTRVIAADSGTVLHQGDVLLLDLFANHDNLRSLCQAMQLEPLHFKAAYFIDQSQDVGMAEVSLPPGSQLIGKNLLELSFRSRYGLNVVGLRREQNAVQTPLVEEKLRLGDTLLVIGPWKSVRQLQAEPRDFIVLSLPAEIDQVAPARARAPQALASLAVMIALMVSGLVPNVIAALIGCLLMGAGRCIDMNSAYRAIHWQSLVLIVGMLPFALALQKTGDGAGESARWRRAAGHTRLPVRPYGADRLVHLQYRHRSVDGPGGRQHGATTGPVALSLRHDRGVGCLGSLHDARLLTGQHLGAGPRAIPLRRFRQSGRAVHTAGHGRQCGHGALVLWSVAHNAQTRAAMNGYHRG